MLDIIMKELEKQFNEFAKCIENMCCNISVRKDANGPFILAFGIKDLHSLELRKVAENYALELWIGMCAEEEELVSKSEFTNIQDAFDCAKNWLSKDCI